MTAEQKKLDKVYQNCVSMLKDIGIPVGCVRLVKVNTRAKKTMGLCTYKYTNIDGKNVFDISISYRLFEPNAEDGLYNTVIHELLHTCDGAFNHGRVWKTYADRVYREYGILITRTSTEEEKGITPLPPAPPKYICRCNKCGKEFTRQRMCDLVKHPWLYFHKTDGGCLERIK